MIAINDILVAESEDDFQWRKNNDKKVMIILKESVKSKFERKAKMIEEVISLKYSWNYHNNKKYLALVVRD